MAKTMYIRNAGLLAGPAHRNSPMESVRRSVPAESPIVRSLAAALASLDKNAKFGRDNLIITCQNIALVWRVFMALAALKSEAHQKNTSHSS